MKQLARLFVTPELSNEVSFGEVRKKTFTIISEDDLRNKLSVNGEKELTSIDFSSTAPDSPWLTAITWFKEISSANEKGALGRKEISQSILIKKNFASGLATHSFSGTLYFFR